MICLDTNVVIGAITGRASQVRARLEAALLAGTTVGIPTTVLYELWYGIGKSARPAANIAVLEAFLALDVTS